MSLVIENIFDLQDRYPTILIKFGAEICGHGPLFMLHALMVANYKSKANS